MLEQNPAESDDDGRQLLGVVVIERFLRCFGGQSIELGSQHAEDSPKANLGRMTSLSLELQRVLERGLFPWCVDLHGLPCLHLFELHLQVSESPRAPWRIRAMVSASETTSRTRMRPPHFRQRVMSMAKTRARSFAHAMRRGRGEELGEEAGESSARAKSSASCGGGGGTAGFGRTVDGAE